MASCPSAPPEARLKKSEDAPRLDHLPFANANAEPRGCDEARFDLDRGHPLARLRIRPQRDHDVDHGDAESALNVAEMVSKCGLRRELDSHEATLEIGVENGERRQLDAHRL